jgi:hypothetical protein
MNYDSTSNVDSIPSGWTRVSDLYAELLQASHQVIPQHFRFTIKLPKAGEYPLNPDV